MKKLKDSLSAGLLAIKIGFAMNPVAVTLGAGVAFAFALAIIQILGF